MLACSSPPGRTPMTAWTARAWRPCAGTTALWWPTSSLPRFAACSLTGGCVGGALDPDLRPDPRPLPEDPGVPAPPPWGHRWQASSFSVEKRRGVWGWTAVGLQPVAGLGSSPPQPPAAICDVPSGPQRPPGCCGPRTGRHLRPAVQPNRHLTAGHHQGADPRGR